MVMKLLFWVISCIIIGIIIRFILFNKFENKTGLELAIFLKEDPMFVSRALYELERQGYCKIIKKGVAQSAPHPLKFTRSKYN